MSAGRRSVFAGLALCAVAGAQQRPLDYRLDVGPWFARLSCAAAECHGGALGRGGFKLSLFGGDPALDHRAITLDRDARRVDFVDPAQSLLLRKPTHELDHGGGRRLTRGSPAESALRTWIALGAPFSAADAPVLESLDLSRDGDRVRAIATIRWDDAGTPRLTAEDVTARSLFDSTAGDVLAVDPDGWLTRRGPGETWITARFAGRDASLRCVEAFAAIGSDAASDDDPLDRAWRSDLHELGLVPAEPASPERLLRRAFLLLAGRLPTPAERAAFLGADPQRRFADLVDSLLLGDDFARVAGGWIADWFEVPPDARLLRDELDRIGARDTSLLAALDPQLAPGRPLLDRLPDPRDRAELFARAALGVRLSCARCHDHPLDRWTRPEHLGFSALFVDARPAADGGMQDGQLFDPASGDAVPARMLALLGTDPRDGPPRRRLRAALLANPRVFARNVVNRVVAILCGRGFVEPVDDHRLTNPGVLPTVEALLVDGFVRDDLRLRPLIRRVLLSSMWSVDSDEPEGDPLRLHAERIHLARREARPLPEPLLRHAAALALGIRDRTPAPPSPSPLALWLSLWNGAEVEALLTTPGSALDLIALRDDDRERIASLFDLLYGREAGPEEEEALRARLAAADDRTAALRSLTHAMLLSREFSSLR
ncbi:MAG: DUF1549 domain-containing protein [Planctomycetota bacterium]